MNKLPYFKVTGTHEEVGQYLGKNFRDKIQLAIKKRKSCIPHYDSYLSISQQCLNVTSKYFPHLLAETEAIANAAKVPLIDFFFMNNREAYDEAEAHDQQQSVNSDHCTVVAGFDNNNLVVGHNEDWSLDAIDDLCILEATVSNTTFISLHYSTVIPGLSASMNNHGLVQCINDIYQINQIGVPKNYVARAILEAKTLDEAEKIIKNTPKASGFNHVLAQAYEIRNIEIAGNIIGLEKTINKPYIHTNHYLTRELQNLEKFHTKSSEARYTRGLQLLANQMTIDNVRSILSDTENKTFPICRPDETIGSAIFTPHNKKSFFCYGHPCAGEYVEYELQ